MYDEYSSEISPDFGGEFDETEMNATKIIHFEYKCLLKY